MTRWWVGLPLDRVARLAGEQEGVPGAAVRDALETALEFLPPDAPAMVRYRPPAAAAASSRSAISSVLDTLDEVARGLFPAWLPGAESLDGPGGLNIAAANALARRAAADGPDFGPFLADLARRALATRFGEAGAGSPGSRGGLGDSGGAAGADGAGSTGGTGGGSDSGGGGGTDGASGTGGTGGGGGVAGADGTGGRGGHSAAGSRRHSAAGSRGPRAAGGGRYCGGSGGGRRRRAAVLDEVRARGLMRVIASSYQRPAAALVVEVPEGLSPAAEQSLVAACEWLAHHGRAGVWLTGAPLRASDRVRTVWPAGLARPVKLPDGDHGGHGDRGGQEPGELVVSYPPLVGRPHPLSRAEQVLEAALLRQPWAAGREWNQSYQPATLANPIKLDLVWRAERCVVEVDGPEHCRPDRYEQDRRRDVDLQLAGFCVLRFTNNQIFDDIDAVLDRIRRLLTTRRHARGKA